MSTFDDKGATVTGRRSGTGRADTPSLPGAPMQGGKDFHSALKRIPREKAVRVRLGSLAFKKKGISHFDMRDPYHLAVALTWHQFFATLLVFYLLVNVVFATFFYLVPGSVANARPYSFPDAFFFSIETLATVGYGEMYPATSYGHIVAASEILCGLGFTAILTGLIFTRFSRPRAKFVFASHPVVATYNGKPTLMLRVGNGRTIVLLDAVLKLNLLLSVRTAEGALFRRAQELPLERAHLPVFPLAWTLMHVMDERSPLYGYGAAQMTAAHAQVFVAVEARDPTLAASVHEIRHYAAEDVRFGMRYVDAVTMEEDGTPMVDLTKIGEIEPDVDERRADSGTV